MKNLINLFIVKSKRAKSDEGQEGLGKEERYFIASQWQLMWRKMRKHKIALTGLGVLLVFYVVAIFCEFFAPYTSVRGFRKYLHVSPQRIHFFDKNEGFQRPFVYGLKKEFRPEAFLWVFVEDKSSKYPIYFLVRGETYKFWDLFYTNFHLFDTKDAPIFLLGTDAMGRDLFSRVLYASRVSLSIGLVGVTLSLLGGMIIGGISGYFGGVVDRILMRSVDFLISIPTLPLWMALSVAIPRDWSIYKTYFAITIILSVVGWTGMARVVRGKLLTLREEDFALAAKLAGANELRIITRHLLPSFMSYIIVSITLSVPAMILGETSLSFLGLGLQAPAVSWGVLLIDAQALSSVVLYPWTLIPVVFVIVTVLAFNFLGDGLRDAADPYK